MNAAQSPWDLLHSLEVTTNPLLELHTSATRREVPGVVRSKAVLLLVALERPG